MSKGVIRIGLTVLALCALAPVLVHAQDEAWVNELTANGEPLMAAALPASLSPIPPQRYAIPRLRNASMEQSQAGVLRRASLRSMQPLRTALGGFHRAGYSRLPIASAATETVDLRCSGGARSGNPDADINIWIYLWVENVLVGSGTARGYSPSAVASATVQLTDSDQAVECAIYAGFAQAFAFGTLLAWCGDPTPTAMREEYRAGQVNWTPNCFEFATSGGSANFSWNELNGGFSTGNPHNPWGIVKESLTTGLEDTRSNYNRGGIRLSGGYRCPHGNANVGGAQHSYHVKGRAADMYSASQPWTEAEFNLVKEAAEDAGAIESLSWTTYADRHYHAAW